MRKSILYLALITSINTTKAQIIQDTVSIGAGYVNDVWYSFQNDEQGNAPKNNWDIAFETSGMGAGIHINSVIGTQLWCYPNSDTSGWNSIDTSGIHLWTPRYNSDTSWSIGAFNVPISSNAYDLGWGVYNNITHNVIGDSIYIIKLSNNTYKKIWIKKLSGGIYYFQYADLNGNNLVTASINKSLYNTKVLIYYSLQNNAIIDREPVSNSWDIVFKQYTAFIPTAYNVTGVLLNKNTPAVKVYPVNSSIYNQWYNHSFNTAINTIGYNWKTYSGSWNIQDSLVYFVKTKQNDIWKLVFKGFGGSANGNYIFTKEKISAAAVEQFSNPLIIKVYPNPANDIIHLIVNASENLSASIEIYDITGKKLFVQPTTINKELNSIPINITNFNKGIYLLKIQTPTSIYVQKIIKQ